MTSYDYLEPGVDFTTFEMSKQIGRVPSQPVAVTEAQDLRVRQIMDDNTIVSAHDHPNVRPVDPADFRPYRRQGREITGYEGLAASGVDVVFDAGVAGVSMNHSHAGWGWEDSVYDIGMRLADWAHHPQVDVVRRYSDIERFVSAGVTGIVLTLECATPIGNEIDKLDVLYGLGVRSIGVAYSEANSLGSGLAELNDGGLTHLGRRAVRRMNQLGMLIDVSHCGDRTALDVVAASDAPVCISHAGARALWGSRRMKPDDVIRAAAGSGGFIGIEAAPHTTLTATRPEHTIDSVMEHFEYCAELVGIDHVAFGPDTHFGDHVAWHHEFSRQLGQDVRPKGPDFAPSPYVESAENPAEAMHNVIRWLVVHGYTDADIKAVAGGNVLRVFRQTVC